MSFWRNLFGGSAPAPSSSGGTPKDLFTDEVEQTLRALPGVTAITRKPEDFALVVVVDGKPHTIFLGNVFTETRDLAPTVRSQRIRRFVAVLAAPEDDAGWEAARPRLVPIVRATSLQIGDGDPRGLPVRRDFLPFVDEWLAVDSPDSMQLVTGSVLDGWKVPPDEPFRVARENAVGFFAKDVIELYDPRAPYRIWHVAKDDDYQPSRLFVPGWLAGFEGRVTGRPVAIVPHRSALIVGGDGDPGCLRRLIDTAIREYSASPRPISPALYTLDATGRIVPLVLPAGHPLEHDVALGHAQLATAEYEGGKKALQDRLGEGIFVASFVAYRGKDDGPVGSYTVWTEDVSSLLPQADAIAFVPKSGETPFRAPWRLVMELAPDSLTRDDTFRPPRWRTTKWPSADALAKLRAASA